MSPTEPRVKPHKPHAPFIHSISDQLIPKDVLPGKLYADLHRWWFPETAEDVEQAKVAIMEQMPLKRDEIYKALFLVPDGTVCFIPDMRFGWVWGNEEIEARGKEAGKCVIVDALRIQSLLSDSDIEGESDVEDGHCAPYSKIMKHWPICTAEVLLEQAVAELGLDKKYPWHRTFFEIRGINQCFDERDKATQFISIYTNKDLAPGVGYAIPSDEDIRRVQDWLGLKDREPGWWLSGTHYMPEPPYRSRRAK